jgi:spore coat polysaccharide biosynthesis predicted glycosyltransferase SpsG
VNVHIVLGSAFTGKEAVSALIAAMPNVSLTVNCSTIAEALSRADVALISGGTLMYEACVLGVPTLVLCQNEPQHQEAEILAGGGAVINLGMHSQVNDERIVSAIKIMLGDTAQRQRLSVTARRLVPSNGTSHIGSKIARRLAWNQALKR